MRSNIKGRLGRAAAAIAVGVVALTGMAATADAQWGNRWNNGYYYNNGYNNGYYPYYNRSMDRGWTYGERYGYAQPRYYGGYAPQGYYYSQPGYYAQPGLNPQAIIGQVLGMMGR